MEDNRDKKLSSENNRLSRVDQAREDEKLLDHAASAWKEIQMQPADTFEQIGQLLEVVRHFIHTYPNTSQYNSALELGQWLEDKRDLLLAWDSEFRLLQFLRRESDFREKARQRLDVLRQQAQGIPSTLPPATPNTQLEEPRSTRLQRQFFFAFKDTNQKLLTPPFVCIINGKDFSNQPEVAVALDVETSEVRITLSKAGFKPYTGSLSIEHYFAHAQEGLYNLLLEPEIYTLTLKALKPNLQDKKADSLPLPNARAEVNITSKFDTGSRYVQYITDSQGCLLISGLRYGDNISGKIYADGLEGVIWIPEFKGDWAEKTICLEDKKQPNHNTEQQFPVPLGDLEGLEPSNGKESDETQYDVTSKEDINQLSSRPKSRILFIMTGIIIAITSFFIFRSFQFQKEELNNLKYSLINQIDNLTSPTHYPALAGLDSLLEGNFSILEQRISENPGLLNVHAQEIAQQKTKHALAIAALRQDTLQAIEQRLYKAINSTELPDSTRMRWRITQEAEVYFLSLLQNEAQAIQEVADTLSNKMTSTLGKTKERTGAIPM